MHIYNTRAKLIHTNITILLLLELELDLNGLNIIICTLLTIMSSIICYDKNWGSFLV